MPTAKTDQTGQMPRLTSLCCAHGSFCWFLYPATFCVYPATQKVAGYYVIPSENFECPRLTSVSALFPDSNLSSFLPIFFKLCMDIGNGEEGFEIANGLNLFINNRVMALD